MCFDLLFSPNLRGYCTISFVIVPARVKTLYEYVAVKAGKRARNTALSPSTERQRK